MEIFESFAGSALSLRGNLIDDDGQAIGYDGPPPPLAAEVWPGGNRAESFAVAATWVDAATGEYQLDILASQTAGLASGRYFGRMTVTDPARGPGVAYSWAIDVRPAPGDEPEPPSYCTFEDLLVVGRSWLKTVQTEDVEAGFAVERGQAREWLDDLILSRVPAARGGAGMARHGWFGSSTDLVRARLDADLLIRRGWVARATALKTFALICDGQVGAGKDDGWAARARLHHNKARSLALASTAELADVAGGPVIYRIDLAQGSLR